MAEFHDDEITRLRIALARISKQLNKQTTSDGLSYAQASVLGTVCRRGPIGASELADVEGLNPTMLSRILAKLEEADLIRRETAEDDRRAVRVVATAAGARKQARLRAQRSRALSAFIARLPAVDAELLLGALPALEQLGVVMMGEAVRA